MFINNKIQIENNKTWMCVHLFTIFNYVSPAWITFSCFCSSRVLFSYSFLSNYFDRVITFFYFWPLWMFYFTWIPTPYMIWCIVCKYFILLSRIPFTCNLCIFCLTEFFNLVKSHLVFVIVVVVVFTNRIISLQMPWVSWSDPQIFI